MPPTLLQRIQTFTREQVQPEGTGWAPVYQDDWNELYEIVRALVETKWARDVDGDLPVQVILVDRTRFESQHWLQVPHELKAETEQERNVVLRRRITNARRSLDELELTFRLLDLAREEK